MTAVAGFENAGMRAEPIGPGHRDGLIALPGDERVGATLGGVAGAGAVNHHIEVEIGWTVAPERWKPGPRDRAGRGVDRRRVMEKLGSPCSRG